MAIKIDIKRVYENPSPQDGTRILVDRLWPRGLKKDDAALDGWAKDLAPSPELRKWFDHRPERFAEFGRRYRAELSDNPAVENTRPSSSRAHVTLLYAAHDPNCNHAMVLADYLRKAWSK
ncbi:DUF488 domain-containing protein [Hyphomicrobium sp.]|uniref:DUF488 domain-containing protein n=1 Tax=Hyphomicrobium sp. TaxID=82 RepID=UPI002BD919A7|nr:DUF488 domain-containing protein [Hyphomicrobium sp.]HVZ04512.1 DUF488 domain-containing protein [Hyphomicrobium sp.]